MNFFAGNKDSPYHISIGAVLIKDTGEVACHHFHRDNRDFYILMRESLEANEPIEDALHRGLMEEFGATGIIIDFLGPLFAQVIQAEYDYTMQKTTLYFLVQLQSIDAGKRREDDPERDSKIEWHSLDHLIQLMKQQGHGRNEGDINEWQILERAKDFIKRS